MDTYPDGTWISFHRLREAGGETSYRPEPGNASAVLAPRFGLQIDCYAGELVHAVSWAAPEETDGPASHWTPCFIDHAVDALLEWAEKEREHLPPTSGEPS